MDLTFLKTEEISLVQLAISLGIAATGISLAILVNQGMNWLAEVTRRSRFRFDGILVKVISRPTAILIGTLAFVYSLRRLKPVNEFLKNWKQLELAVVILILAWMLEILVREVIEVYLQPYAERTDTEFDERLLYLLDSTVS